MNFLAFTGLVRCLWVLLGSAACAVVGTMVMAFGLGYDTSLISLYLAGVPPRPGVCGHGSVVAP
jgi:hypothetical protein